MVARANSPTLPLGDDVAFVIAVAVARNAAWPVMTVCDEAMAVIVAWISLKALMLPVAAEFIVARAKRPILPDTDARAVAVTSSVAVSAALRFGADSAFDAAENVAVKATNGGGGFQSGNLPRRRYGVCGGRKMIMRATGHLIPALLDFAEYHKSGP